MKVAKSIYVGAKRSGIKAAVISAASPPFQIDVNKFINSYKPTPPAHPPIPPKDYIFALCSRQETAQCLHFQLTRIPNLYRTVNCPLNIIMVWGSYWDRCGEAFGSLQFVYRKGNMSCSDGWCGKQRQLIQCFMLWPPLLLFLTTRAPSVGFTV